LGVGWATAPDIEWYDSHDCPTCGAATVLEGLVVRRLLVLVVIPVPLWRDWLVRCRSCRTTWKVDKKVWKERAKTAAKPKDVYEQQQADASKRRAALPPYLLAHVQKHERRGWTFRSETGNTVSLWRTTDGLLIEWLRLSVDEHGRVTKQEQWTE
jgi:hypothetical protein